MQNTSSIPAGSKTAALIMPGAVGVIGPEFIEVQDCARIFGIRRTTLYGLLKDRKIQSILLRKPGCKSGKRLVSAASCREFLRLEMEKQKGTYIPGACNAHGHGRVK